MSSMFVGEENTCANGSRIRKPTADGASTRLRRHPQGAGGEAYIFVDEILDFFYNN